MTSVRFEPLLDARHAVAESPVWSAAQCALFWVDIPARQLWRWNAQDGTSRYWHLPEQEGCIAPADDGNWMCGLESGVALARLPEERSDAEIVLLAEVRHPLPNMRFNDGRCDRQGRFRAGTMFMDMAAAKAVGSVYGLDSVAAGLQQLHAGLLTPNGMAFSPDGRTMYLSDSHPHSQQVWTFDYDPHTGSATNQKAFVDMQHHPGRPDGAAVDVDGCYWICANDAGMVHRFTPSGRLDLSLRVPVSKPAMCAFGGADHGTLFVTSIRPAGTARNALDGAVFAARTGHQGLAETPCPATQLR